MTPEEKAREAAVEEALEHASEACARWNSDMLEAAQRAISAYEKLRLPQIKKDVLEGLIERAAREEAAFNAALAKAKCGSAKDRLSAALDADIQMNVVRWLRTLSQEGEGS